MIIIQIFFLQNNEVGIYGNGRTLLGIAGYLKLV